MKKILILLTTVITFQGHCGIFNGITRTIAETKYLVLGYQRIEKIEEDLQGTGLGANLICTKDIQDREWCKVKRYYKIR